MSKRHYVHVYAVIRVKVEVDAESHLDAMKRADDLLFANGFAVRLRRGADCVLDAEYADEITGYLVDESDDPDCSNSRSYHADYRLYDPTEPAS